MRVKKIFVFITLPLIFAILFGGCSLLRWQIKEVTLRVYAIQEDSEYFIPIAGAKIEISGSVYTTPSSTTTVSKTVYTNSNGEAIVNLPPGTYKLTISKDGYNSVTESIVIYTLQTSGGSYNFYLSEESNTQ